MQELCWQIAGVGSAEGWGFGFWEVEMVDSFVEQLYCTEFEVTV